MARIRLIHWNAAEAARRVKGLRAAGYQVDSERMDITALRALREGPPTAVVIDLTRSPSQGRDVALAIRKYRTTRHVPLVFVGGDLEKVAAIEKLLPDAVYTTWGRIRASVKHALSHAPEEPVVPGSLLAGYEGTPLPKKLGIKSSSAVRLVDAPSGFESALGELPEGVALRRRGGGRSDLVLWFVRSRRDLEARIERLATLAGRDGLWIIWPKKTSGIITDLSQVVVRRAGLASGLVDYKVSAIDSTWSGLRFTRRKASQWRAEGRCLRPSLQTKGGG